MSSPARQSYPAFDYVLEESRKELAQRKIIEGRLLSEAETLSLIEKVSRRIGFELSRLEQDEILNALEQEDKVFGVLQPLVDDPFITDIIVSNANEISYQRDRRTFSTSIKFPTQALYEAFVERILQKGDASYSTKQPIADGIIGGFARIHAVHRSICETGPYLTIRLNRYRSIEIGDLETAGMMPKPILEYLKALVLTGQTLLITGEVGTGKTTLVRALASAMPKEESLLVIEDTPEIRLHHPFVRYLSTRPENFEGAGKVSPSECIRAGMRMAMNRIIFGEIRDAEAAESFIDVCSSGHPGLSTLHAKSSSEALVRLELFLGRAQPGVGRNVLTEQIVTAVQVIVHITVCPKTHRRRVSEVREIGPVADGVVRQRLMFSYEGLVNQKPSWKAHAPISAFREKIRPYLNSSYDNTSMISGVL